MNELIRRQDKDLTEYYNADEVDRVIAELNGQIDSLRTKLAEQTAQRVLAETQLDYNNYKRCLDKASYWIAVGYQCVDDKHRRRAERHHRKWLELASKFEQRR